MKFKVGDAVRRNPKLLFRKGVGQIMHINYETNTIMVRWEVDFDELMAYSHGYLILAEEPNDILKEMLWQKI